MDTTLEESAKETLVASSEATAIWNPIAAALWSLLLTPAFGAWLNMRNWERLGLPDKARAARYWFAAMLVICTALCFVPAAAILLDRDDLQAPWWTGLALFGIWCALSAYPQIKHVDEHHGEQYARNSWAAPVLIGLALNCAIVFAAAVLASFLTAAAY